MSGNLPAEQTTLAAHLPEILIVTGLSGAGRSTAANALEDLGWYVVDNLPPGLLPRLADLGGRTQGAVPRLAAVVDARSRTFFADLRAAMGELTASGAHPKVLFLEASDDALVRRFEAVRRPHPLQGGGRVVDGISRERALLADLRADADLIIDTTDLNVHQLAQKVTTAFQATAVPSLRMTVLSFGFKYGLPLDADLIADVRFLPNPHWVPELRPRTGLETPVREYVLAQDGATDFIHRYHHVLQLVAAGYKREGKHYATLGVGCTGGKHRSVVIAEALAEALGHDGVEVSVVHRDLGRE